jgi:16S rRNA (uracil1498-N3)-methyltransferase
VHLFYTADLNPGHSSFQLSEEESKHAVRVLRLNVGDKVQLIDGIGGFYQAEIADAHPKRTQLKIISNIP